MFHCVNYNSEMCEVAFKAGDKVNIPAILIEKELGVPIRHTQYDLAEAEVKGVILKVKEDVIKVLLDVRVWITRENLNFTKEGSKLVPQEYFFESSEENIQEYKQKISRINFAGGLNEKVLQKMETLLKNMQSSSIYKLTYPRRLCIDDDTYKTDVEYCKNVTEYKIPEGTEIEIAYMHKALDGMRKDVWYGNFVSKELFQFIKKEGIMSDRIHTIVPFELEKNQAWID